MSPRPGVRLGTTLRESVTAVWLARRDLVDYALLPIIYSLALALFVTFAADGPMLTTDAEGRPVYGDPVYYLNALTILPTVMFVTGWLRRALYGPGGPERLPGTGWGRRETRVLLGMLALLVGSVLLISIIGQVAALLLGPTVAHPVVAAFVIFVPTIYLFARLVLQIPAAAGGATGGFALAWKLSAGNGHRIAFGLLVLGLGTTSLVFFVAALVSLPLAAIYGAETEIGIGGSVAVAVVTLLVYYAGTAAACETLARMYRDLGGPLSPPAPQAAND
jgi:hypothetical protein